MGKHAVRQVWDIRGNKRSTEHSQQQNMIIAEFTFNWFSFWMLTCSFHLFWLLNYTKITISLLQKNAVRFFLNCLVVSVYSHYIPEHFVNIQRYCFYAPVSVCIYVIIKRAARLTGRYIHMHTINMKSKYLLCIFCFSLPSYSETSFVDGLLHLFPFICVYLVKWFTLLVSSLLFSSRFFRLKSNDSNKHDHCCLCLAPTLLHLHSSSNSCLLHRNRFVFGFKTKDEHKKVSRRCLSDSCKTMQSVGDRII